MPVAETKVSGTRINDNSAGWTYSSIPGLIGGIRQNIRADLIDGAEASDSVNVFSEVAEVRSETGYAPFSNADTKLAREATDGFLLLETGGSDILLLFDATITAAVVGKPRKGYTFVRSDGTTEEMLFASRNVYRLINGSWHFIGNGTDTTTTDVLAAGGFQLIVADSTGFTAGEAIGVVVEGGGQHKTTIDTVDDGTHITMDDAIPVGESVGVGADVVEAAVLVATPDANQFSVATITAQDWVVFTNGVDVVKKFDGTTLVITDLGGLSTANVDTCKALAVFHAYLVLFAPTISATPKPQQVRWCDTGNYEEWVTGNAGFEELFDSDDELRRGALLGPYLIIYRSNSIVRMELVGQLGRIFNFDTMVRGEGAVSHDAVVITEDRHIVWGQVSLYEYLGDFGVKRISENVRNKVWGPEGELDQANTLAVTGRFTPDILEAWFFYPSVGNALSNKLLRYRIDSGAFWVREFPITIAGIGDFLADVRTRDVSITVLCENADPGETFEYNLIADTDNGATISWNIDTKDFFNPYWEAVVDSFDFEAAGTSVVISYSKDRGATWTVYDTVTLTAEIDKYIIFGQFLTNTLRWRFAGTGSDFRLQGAGFKHKPLSRDNLA